MSVSPSSRFANKRKARESNPHHPKVARVSSAARQTVSGCLPKQSEWTGRESNPSHRSCKDQSPPWNMPAHLIHSEVRPGIEPGLRPYHRRVLPQHLQTLFVSVITDGIEPSVSCLSRRRLSRWTTRSCFALTVVETGVEPAKSLEASHLVALPVCVLDLRK